MENFIFDTHRQLYTLLTRGSEFSSYGIELRNRVTQSDTILRVTNANI